MGEQCFLFAAPKEQKESEKEESAEEPRDISLKVDMDCQGCAKKVEKSLLIFEGVENVRANSQPKTVVVKSRTADPTKKEKQEHTLRPPTKDEKKEELLEKQISKIEGVESVEADLPNDQVIVKGDMDPAMLVENIQKKIRREAVMVKEEKTSEGEKSDEVENKANDDGGVSKLKKYDSWPPARYYVDDVNPYSLVYPYSPVEVYRYPPTQLSVTDEFSGENPNACTIV
uniref:HMA domain-containing protein n=1 Tax=Aegilops tauschii TaxID=37682 RepID=M8C3P8_AEGTA